MDIREAIGVLEAMPFMSALSSKEKQAISIAVKNLKKECKLRSIVKKNYRKRCDITNN